MAWDASTALMASVTEAEEQWWIKILSIGERTGKVDERTRYSPPIWAATV